MKKIECTLIFADESSHNLGIVDLPTALKTFRDFPWQEEMSKVDVSGCIPTISFGVVPLGKQSDYLNISCMETGVYAISMEAIRPGRILGLIPIRKSASYDKDEVDALSTEATLKQFFTLPGESLAGWIRRNAV